MRAQSRCAELFHNVATKDQSLQLIFKKQLEVQRELTRLGKSKIDYDKAEYMERVADITTQWRNLTLEFAELLERLPFKEWRNYSTIDKFEPIGDELLELQYEYADMFCFFINIGLALRIDGTRLAHLFHTKSDETLNRQKRGY